MTNKIQAWGSFSTHEARLKAWLLPRGGQNLEKFIGSGNCWTITLTNTSTSGEASAFYVIATYAYDGGLFDMVYIPMVVEEATNLSPGQSETLRIFYKKGSQGGCPNEDSNITFNVLASNDSGTFYIGSRATTWDPQRVAPLDTRDLGALSLVASETLDPDAPSIENPLDSHILGMPGQLKYEGQIWMVNPFTRSISTTITQTMPADTDLLQFGDGTFDGSTITWQRELSVGQVEQITYTFRYLGVPGTPVTVPPAMMAFTETLSNTFVSVDSYPVTFISSLPVVAEGHSPGRIMPGIVVTVPITVTNLLTDNTASGSVTLQITDTSDVLVHDETQGFTLGPTESQTLSFEWPSSLNKGYYMAEVSLNYGSARKVVFRDLILVGLSTPQVTLVSDPAGIVQPGDLISFTIRMTNTTGITLSNATITATIPVSTTVMPEGVSDGGMIGSGSLHWDFPELLEDRSIEVSFTVQIDRDALEDEESSLVQSEVWVESERIHSGAPRAETWNLLLHPPPGLISVEPSRMPNNVSMTITIVGTDFLATPTVTISPSLSLDVSFINTVTLTATVPAGLPLGVYTMTVTNPDAQFDTFPKAITITEAAPVAAFSAVPTSGPRPFTVQFTDESTGTIDLWSWTFGDGRSNGLQNPAHTYTATRVYTVSLTVSGPGGMDTLTRTNYITAYTPAQASFTAAPTSGVTPLTVDFNNFSTGEYDTCIWTFGDSGTGNNCNNPSHIYTTTGVYTVSLTVSGLGGIDTLTHTNYITTYEPVQAGFTAWPTSGIVPLTVVFTNTSTGDYTTSLWGFGDEVTSTLGSPIHIYTAVGEYTVTLMVSGPGGSDTETKAEHITVQEEYGIYLPLILRSH